MNRLNGWRCAAASLLAVLTACGPKPPGGGDAGDEGGAVLALSEAPAFDFGTRAVGSAVDHTFTLANSGTGPGRSISAGALSAPFSFKAGAYPGEGGTCRTSLDPNASCTLVVTFSPTAAEAAQGQLALSYQDGAATQTLTLELKGSAALPAQLTISDGPAYDFLFHAVGASTEHAFTITNAGQMEATALLGTPAPASPFSFTGGDYPGGSGTCGQTLAAGASCTVELTYAPIAQGNSTGTLSLSYHDGAQPRTTTRELAGTAFNPALLTLSHGPTYDFGTWAPSSTTEHTFTLSNTGGVSATALAPSAALTSPFAFKGGSYPGVGGSCASTLPVGANCTLVVAFAPSTVGSFTASLGVAYFDGAADQLVSRSLTGQSTAQGFLEISGQSPYDFGTIATGTSKDQSFTLTNKGPVAATAITAGTLSSPFSFKDGAYPGTGGTCATTLAQNASCTFVLTFSPTTGGPASGTVTLEFFDGASNRTASRALTGTGASLAVLSISDGPVYDFNRRVVNSSTDHSFTVTNNGAGPASSLVGSALSLPFLYKDGSYPGSGGNCSNSLAAGASCTLVVAFAPSAAGLASANLSLTYNDGLQAQATTRSLTGTGADAANLAFSEGPLFDFGTRPVGSSTERSLTLTNGGGVSATGLSASTLPAPLSYLGGTYPGSGGTCTNVLSAASTCTLVISFAPSVAGSTSGDLQLAYSNGLSTQTLTLSLTGVAATPASLAFGDGTSFSFGTQAVGSSSDHLVTVTNSGGVRATGLNASGLALPFTFKGGAFPGTGGSCSSQLNAAASCTLMVNYSPLAQSSASATLVVSYFNGLASQTFSLILNGQAAAPALLSGSGAAHGLQANGSTTDQIFTFTHSGGVPATGITPGQLSAPFTFKGGSYPGTSGTCSTSLTVGASCTVVVSFAPVSTGAYAGTLALNYSDGAVSQVATASLVGEGAPAAALVLADHDFGTRATGSSTEFTLSVANSGGVGAANFNIGALGDPFTQVSNNCSSTLDPGTSCAVVVRFAPTSTVASSATLTFSFDSGLASETASVTLQGVGAAPALLATSGFDFGVLATGASAEHAFTLTNGGGVPSTGMSGLALLSPYRFKGGSYPGTGATCSDQLNPSQSCTVILTFSPVATGAHPDQLRVGYSDGAAPQTLTATLGGTGAAPALLTLGGLSFGTRATGSSLVQSVTLTNSGGVPATALGSTLAAPFAFEGGAYPGGSGSCAVSLAPGLSCTMSVVFSPTITGSFNSALTMAYHDGAQAQTASSTLQGVGANPALLAFDGGPYDFGLIGVGGLVHHLFYLTNSGGVPATGIAASGLSAPLSFKGGGTFPGSGGSCTAALAPGATCLVVVSFAPTSAAVTSQTLSLIYQDGAGAQQTSQAIQGTATSQAALAITDWPLPYYVNYGVAPDGPSFDFGAQGINTRSSHTFSLNNNGAAPATALGGAALGGDFAYAGGAFPGAGGTCGTSLAAGASCTVVVDFAPSASGASSATLTVLYNDGLASATATRPLTGTGTAQAVLALSDYQGIILGSAYDFGSLGVGSSTPWNFYVHNSGQVAATALAAGAMAAGFGFVGGSYPGQGGTCGATLAAASWCTLAVQFAPVAAGPATGQVSLSYHDGLATRSASRAVKGMGTTAALLQLTEDDQGGGLFTDFGTLAVNASAERTLVVRNLGAADATTLSATALPPPFAFKGGSYPGNGGTCAASLPAQQSCSLVVLFSPTASGPYASSVSLSYHDGTSTQTASRGLSGAATSWALLRLYSAEGGGGGPGEGLNFGTTGFPVERTISVSNIGAQAATAIAAQALSNGFGFSGGSFPGTSGTCGATLAAGASCTLKVTFTPSGNGARGSTLALSYSDGSATTSSGLGLNAIATSQAYVKVECQDCRDEGLDFGTAGQPVERNLQVKNQGALSATALADGGGLGSGFAYKGGTYPGTGGTCGSTLASGAECQVVVAFSPSGAGARSASLILSYHDGAAPQTTTMPLRATATDRALLSVRSCSWCQEDSSPIDFGVAGLPRDQELYLRNGGAQSASALAGLVSGGGFSFQGGSYPGTSGTCGATLAVGADCKLVLTFQPSGDGQRSGTLAVSFNDGSAAASTSRALVGTATSLALLTVREEFGGGEVAEFGMTGVPIQRTFYLENQGAQNATAIADGATLGDGFDYQAGTFPGTGGTCGVTLAAGARCSLVLSFTPSGSGERNSTLSLAYHDGSGMKSATRSLHATAISGALLQLRDCSQCGGGDQPFDFGISGVPKEHTFTLTNQGAQAATSISASALTPPFSFQGGSYPGTGGTCGDTLASAADCTVVVAFSPSGNGQSSSALTFDYLDGSTSRQVTRGLTGTSTDKALLTLFDWDANSGGGGPQGPFDFGTRGVPEVHRFTVLNQGMVAATALAGSTLGSDFSFEGGAFPGSSGTCLATLASDASCTVTVRFNPSGSGPRSGSLSLSYHDGVATASLSRDLVGTATALALLSASTCQGGCGGDQPVDFGASGVRVERHVYLFNQGGQSATGLGGSLSPAADFTFKGGAFPGTNGDCTGTLGRGAECLLVLEFTPTGASGLRSGTLSVGYSDGGGGTANLNRGLIARVASEALLRIDGWTSDPSAPPYDFGPTGVVLEHLFEVKNTGGATATAMTASGLGNGFAFKGGSYPGQGGDCAASLSVGASCSLVLTFTPSGTGTRFSTLSLGYHDGANPVTSSRALTAVAIDSALLRVTDCPNCTFSSPGAYNFGSSGIATHRTLGLFNTGALSATGIAAATLSNGFEFKGGSYPGVGGSCTSSLLPGQTCDLVLTYNPSGTTPASSLLDLSYEDGKGGTSSATRQLTGTPLTTALLEVSTVGGGGGQNAPPYDFGVQGLPEERTFTITNIGGTTAGSMSAGAAMGDGFAFSGTTGYPGTGGTCAVSLAPGATCTLKVTFTPSGEGPRSTTLALAYHDGTANQTAARALLGTATAKAALTLTDCSWCGSNSNPPPVEFGVSGVAVERTLYLTNDGKLAATGLQGAVSGANFAFKGGSYPGAGGSCGTELSAGAAPCTLTVVFTPTGSGARSGSLTLTFNDGAGSASATASLSGTATDQALLSITHCQDCGTDGRPFEFGVTGQPRPKVLYLRNTGGAAASVLSSSALGNGFAYAGGTYPGSAGTCGTDLLVGAYCTLVIEFSPAGDGLRSTTLTLDFEGPAPATVSRTLSATATTLAYLEVLDSSCAEGPCPEPVRFGSTSTSALTRTLTVRNVGSKQASSIGAPTPPSPFGYVGANGYPGAGGTCGSTLNENASCTLEVEFAPLVSGYFSGVLTLTYFNSSAATSSTRWLEGSRN